MKRPIVVYETLNKMKIKIKVHTNSSQEKIEKIKDGSYEVWIKEKPLDNKANIYLEKFLKKFFKKNVQVVKGLKSKNKIVQVGEINEI